MTGLADPQAGAAPAAPSAQGTVTEPGEAARARSLTITDGAVAYAREKLAKRGTPEAAVRLGIKGGGCSGFSYVIEFSDDPPRARDQVLEVGGVRFYVDKKSMLYLAGSALDYERTLMFQGFKFRNPQEATRCGCGHSFTVR
ncbi:MAG: iron-sulfur cluster assembly accessory protein [Polyangiaceae bacterium]|nr:iron-sulfur cluster assembly accessory protein [Polyangiaceae bacterium]MCW5788902.1 iron-sulfur cluster assembly accessory protein [Polyangiaceae bacterium]